MSTHIKQSTSPYTVSDGKDVQVKVESKSRDIQDIPVKEESSVDARSIKLEHDRHKFQLANSTSPWSGVWLRPDHNPDQERFNMATHPLDVSSYRSFRDSWSTGARTVEGVTTDLQLLAYKPFSSYQQKSFRERTVVPTRGPTMLHCEEPRMPDPSTLKEMSKFHLELLKACGKVIDTAPDNGKGAGDLQKALADFRDTLPPRWGGEHSTDWLIVKTKESYEEVQHSSGFTGDLSVSPEFREALGTLKACMDSTMRALDCTTSAHLGPRQFDVAAIREVTMYDPANNSGWIACAIHPRTRRLHRVQVLNSPYAADRMTLVSVGYGDSMVLVSTADGSESSPAPFPITGSTAPSG